VFQCRGPADIGLGESTHESDDSDGDFEPVRGSLFGGRFSLFCPRFSLLKALGTSAFK
jgi:hypothetical protein